MKFRHKCDACKKDKPTGSKRADPFEKNVNGRTVKKYLCDDCYRTISLLSDVDW